MSASAVSRTNELPAPAPAASLLVTPSQTVGPFLAIGLPWPDGPWVVPEGTPGCIVITGRVLDVAADPVPDALVETWQADADGRFDHPDDPRGAVHAGGSEPSGSGPSGSGPSGSGPLGSGVSGSGPSGSGVSGSGPSGSGVSPDDGAPDDGAPGDTGHPRAITVRFRGFGRCPTDAQGRYRIVTVKPGPLPCPDGGTEAPHLDVSVFARGLLDRVVTRIYFPDEADANEADPVLTSIADPRRRATLIAVAEPATVGGQAGRSDQGGAYRFDIRLRGHKETVFFDA